MLCAFCNQDGMVRRLDKKGRVFLQCGFCATRCFTRTIVNVQCYESNLAFLADRATLEQNARVGEKIAQAILKREAKTQQVKADAARLLEEKKKELAESRKG